MAAVVTTAEAKQHLRVLNNKEDALIQIYIDAATDYITNYLNRAIPGTVPDYTDSPPSYPQIPNAIKAAAFLIIHDLFEHRGAKTEAANIKENPAVVNLLYPYRISIGI